MIENVGATSAPASSSVIRGPGGAMGKDEFLKLFIAQMKNQDPLNPMQGQDLAAQLAQFSSVEQLIQMNEQMTTQAGNDQAMAQAMNGNIALGALGRTVVAAGNQVEIQAGSAGSVSAAVGGAGGEAMLRIYDSAGREVGSRALGVVGSGRQTWELGGAAAGLPPGTYTFAVDVTDPNGEPVPVQTLVSGRVDGVRYGSNGPVLTAGQLSIPIGQIIEIVTGG